MKSEVLSLMPTMPGTFEQMTGSLTSILEKLDRVDLEGIGAELKGTLKGTNAIANGNWHHVAFVADAAGVRIWVDNRVDFTDSRNMMVAGITLMLGAGDFFGEYSMFDRA